MGMVFVGQGSELQSISGVRDARSANHSASPGAELPPPLTPPGGWFPSPAHIRRTAAKTFPEPSPSSVPGWLQVRLFQLTHIPKFFSHESA